MNASAWDKASLGVGIVPDWLFWLILWWAAWFAAFLSWHVHTNRGRIEPLVLVFIALFSGVMPLMMIVGGIVKRIRGDK